MTTDPTDTGHKMVLVTRQFLESLLCPTPGCDGSGWVTNTGPDPQHDSCPWCEARDRFLAGDLPDAAAPTDTVPERDEYDQKSVDIINNLAMLVRRLCYKHPNDKLTDQAMAYLRGEKLEGSILRESAPSAASGLAQKMRELLKWPRDPRTCLPPDMEGFNDGVHACLALLRSHQAPVGETMAKFVESLAYKEEFIHQRSHDIVYAVANAIRCECVAKLKQGE